MSSKIIKQHAIIVDQENKTTIGNVFEEAGRDWDNARLSSDAPQRHPEMSDADWEMEIARNKARETMRNATEKAGEILENARKEATYILNSVEDRLEEERQKTLNTARHQGHSEGYDAGHNEGAAEARRKLDEAEELLEQTISERERAIADFEPRAVELIIKVIDKLVLSNTRTNPDVVLNLVKQGLSEASFTGDVTLRVSKDDYERVVENKDELMSYVTGGANLEIVADHSLNPADCLVETPFGVVDSSLSMQFEEIKQDLAQIISS